MSLNRQSVRYRLEPGQNDCRHQHRKTGLTIIELVVVMLILGILGATAIPKFQESLASFRAQSAASRIVGDLKFAKRFAQQTSATVVIQFDVPGNGYLLVGVADADRPSQAHSVDFSEADFKSRLVSADFGGTSNLSFNFDGHPSAAGTVVVRSGGTLETVEVTSGGTISKL